MSPPSFLASQPALLTRLVQTEYGGGGGLGSQSGQAGQSLAELQLQVITTATASTTSTPQYLHTSITLKTSIQPLPQYLHYFENLNLRYLNASTTSLPHHLTTSPPQYLTTSIPQYFNTSTTSVDCRRCQGELLKDGASQCVICLSEFVERAEVRRLSCLHLFHTSCVDAWLLHNRVCPVCRVDVEASAAQFRSEWNSAGGRDRR